MSDKNYRIYIDGIFDLFHRGHLDILTKAKEFRKNTTLIVGVISDEDAKNYKRQPIYCQDDRYSIISSIKYVDEVIFNSPLIINKDFITKNKIDIVLHSFANKEDIEKQKEFYKEIDDIFYIIPYNGNISTTNIINKLKDYVI